ncbi:unnamed protein product [Cuscuta europaea]|uniref:Uncharacterized protein n=1 Tax=Cuscuta europaea TaxID=41803 RepID=A0A9P1EAE6_CUSEU|nr:unnamed protein product [Cuscuta europaea]
MMRRGNVIACTLWGPMVEMLLTYKLTTSDPIVMLLQCCRARKYQGHVRVSNMFNTTKVILNGTEDEFMDFRSRMNERAVQGLSFTIQSDNSNDEDIASGQQELLTIDDLSKLQEDGKHWVYGEITAIDNYKDRSYVSCIGCNRKVRLAVLMMRFSGLYFVYHREFSCLLGKSAASLKDQITRVCFNSISILPTFILSYTNT